MIDEATKWKLPMAKERRSEPLADQSYSGYAMNRWVPSRNVTKIFVTYQDGNSYTRADWDEWRKLEWREKEGAPGDCLCASNDG